MAIRDLIPFHWRRERESDAERHPVRYRDPFSPFERDFEDLFSAFFGDMPTRWQENAAHALTPKVNISEDDKQLLIEAEMPGMDEQDIDVSVERDRLILRGEKRREHREGHGRNRRIECSYGSFERVLPLPEYALPDQAKAEYRQGVLRVTVPKDAAKANSRRIPIKVG